MEKPQPNHAGHRFIKGRRQEAVAEIEGWIASTRAETVKAGASRVSSQPSKNVTEQKMLDSKLYDMSKQRFNFILHCQWQRKLFLEKQKRKTVVMRDLLRNVDLVAQSDKRRATVAPGDTRQRQATKRPQKAATTQPRERTRDWEANAEVERESAFVTKLGYLPSSSGESVDDVDVKTAGSEVTNSLVGRRWPICDERYVRLSQSLCENYPKRGKPLLKVPASVY